MLYRAVISLRFCFTNSSNSQDVKWFLGPKTACHCMLRNRLRMMGCQFTCVLIYLFIFYFGVRNKKQLAVIPMLTPNCQPIVLGNLLINYLSSSYLKLYNNSFVQCAFGPIWRIFFMFHQLVCPAMHSIYNCILLMHFNI